MNLSGELLTYLNGQIMPHSEAMAALQAQGPEAAGGFYDTERTFDGQVFRLRHHLERLYRGLTFSKIDPGLTLEEMDIDAWREVFRVNVDGTLLCSKAALPHMKRQGSGSIIIMGSVSGVLPYVGGGAYATTKAALAMLTRVLALEAGPYGVRVNCIAPGAIRHRVDPGESQAAAPHIPIGRAGTIDDVAHMVSYLASDQATYLTGSVIVLDGGATAGRVRQRG